MDIQKTMEFILEQQAKTSINIDRLMEAQYNSKQRIARNEEMIARNEEMIGRNEAAIGVLIESQQRLGDYIKEVSSGLDHLKERVDALVLVVDSLIPRPPAA